MTATTTLVRRATPAAELLQRADAPRADWLAARRHGIGGSDALAVLGLDRYSSRLHVYLDKRGLLPERPETEAMRWGRRLEPVVAAWFAEETGYRLRRVGLLRSADRPWQLASLDRQVYGCPDGPCLLECKNTSVWRRDDWDDDQVADAAEAQAAHYLAVTGYSHAHVAVLIGGNQPEVRRVNRDETLIGDLCAMEADLWRMVCDHTPPPLEPASPATSSLLDQLYPTASDGRAVELDAAAVAELRRYRELGDQIAELKAQRDAARNAVAGRLGDAEIGLVDGAPVVSLRNTSPFSTKRFGDQHPKLAAQYTRQMAVDQVDTAALRADHPDVYRACRARRFLPSKGV